MEASHSASMCLKAKRTQNPNGRAVCELAELKLVRTWLEGEQHVSKLLAAACSAALPSLPFSPSHPLSGSLKSWVEPSTLNKYSKGGGSGGGLWAGSTSRRLSTGTATGSKVYSGFNFTFSQPIRKQRLHWPSGCRSVNSLATEAAAAPPRPPLKKQER